MTSEQPTVATGLQSGHPPIAKRAPVERTHHGDTVIDEYAWLADKTNPETIAYLTAENAYTEAVTSHLAPVRATVFEEIKNRTKETDLSVPIRKGQHWYYSRTEEGKQYRIHCRRLAGAADEAPPIPTDGQPLEGEEVLLDENDLAAGHDFFALGTVDVSPDGARLAYSTDFDGDERFTLHVKDLATGEPLPDTVEEVAYGSAWSSDSSTLFYLTMDASWRPYRVWRHTMGEQVPTDPVVFEESDERFWVDVELSRSERFILIESSSKITSEVYLIPADAPATPPRVIAPRRQGVEYHVEHYIAPAGPGEGEDRFLILHNDQAEDFALSYASVEDPGEWHELIAHQPGTRLMGVEAFAHHLVISQRSGGLTGLRVIPLDGGEEYDIRFPEPLYTVGPGGNPEFETTTFRLGYTSLITPDSVYDCDLATGQLTFRKRKPVLADFDPANYQQTRLWAVAKDGVRVPISLVYRNGVPRDGTAPCVLYGYGSYEASLDPWFSIARLSLLDRGVIFAVAHVRGGGELGRRWYEDGKMLAKQNTFLDFIACARHLADSGWTSPQRLVARGGSAGGLLMGAVANLAPEAFAGIVAEVPFVDALNSILDPSLPLTVIEWEEWGNPLHSPEVYEYMRLYSPYENVGAHPYPAILAMTSLNDTRVLFHEPAKWVAKLRATSPGVEAILKTELEAGHGGRSGRYDAWHEEAFILAWILDRLAVV
jgi:oligopeptidase B